MILNLKHLQRFSFVFFILFYLFSFIGTVNAQNGLSIKVQPSTIEEKVNPGDILEGNLIVTNEEGGEQTYYIKTVNISGVDDEGTPTFSEDATATDLGLEAASWLKPMKDSITIGEKQSGTIPYHIEVPEDASPGTHVAAFFIMRKADNVEKNGAGVGFNVATLVNLRVSGNVIEDMLFREFKTDKSFFTEPVVNFESRIDNAGTIHQRPVGIIVINDMFGNEIGQVGFNVNKGAILPHQDRVFKAEWKHDGFALGKYTATASISFGENSKRTLTKEVSFWIIPVKEVGIAIGVIIFILLIFILTIRSYVKRALRKAGYSTRSKNKINNNMTFAKRLTKTLLWIILLLIVLFIGIIVFSA